MNIMIRKNRNAFITFIKDGFYLRSVNFWEFLIKHTHPNHLFKRVFGLCEQMHIKRVKIYSLVDCYLNFLQFSNKLIIYYSIKILLLIIYFFIFHPQYSLLNRYPSTNVKFKVNGR